MAEEQSTAAGPKPDRLREPAPPAGTTDDTAHRGAQPRAAAARTLCRVVDAGAPLDVALSDRLKTLTQPQDQAFLKELSFGVLRWFERLNHTLERYLSRPLRPKDSDLRMLMLVGLYQLRHLDTPAHAAVSATVDATAVLRKTWAKPLVNAVLRRAQREAGDAAADQNPEARHAHPQWLIDRIRADWPEQWQSILQANNERPPQYLRVNATKTTRARYLDELAQAKLPAEAVELAPGAIRMLTPTAIEKLPGFAAGRVSIQDLGAQLAAALLPVQAGDQILDACAAPGGKTALLCEQQPPPAGMTAIDIDAQRVARLRATLRRLDLQANMIQADASAVSDWWQGQPFDSILLDAPCSATGVIRRHPDIKRLKSPTRVAAAQRLQQRLLASLWTPLRSGGMLLYATCSVLHAENDHTVAAFLQARPDAQIKTIAVPWGVPTRYGRQLLPGQHDTDGFYYALLRKTPTP